MDITKKNKSIVVMGDFNKPIRDENDKILTELGFNRLETGPTFFCNGKAQTNDRIYLFNVTAKLIANIPRLGKDGKVNHLSDHSALIFSINKDKNVTEKTKLVIPEDEDQHDMFMDKFQLHKDFFTRCGMDSVSC